MKISGKFSQQASLRAPVGAEAGDAAGGSAARAQGAGISAAWPAIEGIDGHTAALRLDNDVGLFLSALRRLVREFGAIADEPPPEGASAGERGELTFRMHKLRGSAGMVEAGTVRKLAATLEGALRSDASTASALASWPDLQHALRELRRASAPFLETGDEPYSGATEGVAPIGAADLKELTGALQLQDLDALALFAQHRDAIRQRVGPECFTRIEAALEGLDFGAVLAELHEAEDPQLGASA